MPISRTLSVAPTKKMDSSTERSSVNGQLDKSGRMHKRSRSGCFTCRLRRKKCDEGHPSCKACANLFIKCEYKRPTWWSNAEDRRQQKEKLKSKIKQTKSSERSGSLHAHINHALSPPSSGDDFNRPIYIENYDPNFGPHFSTPGFVPISYAHHYPYEVDVKTERQTFVNDVPLRHDSSVSTFNAMGPPQLHATLPTFVSREWFQEEGFDPSHQFSEPSAAMRASEIGPYHSSSNAYIPLNENDEILKDHFKRNVLPLMFPILQVHHRYADHKKSVSHSLGTNKSYLHCCLGVAATHLKTSGLYGEQLDHDIMRHRFEAISELCQALNKDDDHEAILDATLAMIFFHCSVGKPEDKLPDIPWSDHFQAVSNLASKLDLTNKVIPYNITHTVPPFSLSLTSWIDILGATMLGKTPQFAHSYRSKHLTGTSSGLRELMGCDDRVMYLISEIACLESLKMDGRIGFELVCEHVTELGKQLNGTEDDDPMPRHCYSPASGTINPEELTRTVTIIFRIAARIYLCSLVPGSDRNEESIVELVKDLTNALHYIPAGPFGFDRSLVWPLLIAGAFSTPSSTFREALGTRVTEIGELADLGSIGRMYQLLEEYWRLTDDGEEEEEEDENPSTTAQETPLEPGHQVIGPRQEVPPAPLPSPGLREIKRQEVHWRDVMNRQGWRYLLI